MSLAIRFPPKFGSLVHIGFHPLQHDPTILELVALRDVIHPDM